MKPLGGQALIEGVMIKAPDNVSMAARLPNKEIKVVRSRHVSLTQRYRLLGLPFVRGVISLFEMMVIGVKALTWSANQQGEEEELGPVEWAITFGLAFALTIGLFVLLPYYGAKWVVTVESWTFGALEGIIRLAVFLLYLLLIGRMADVRRMFEYHGAEHMAVHCYEHKLDLTVKNVKKFPPEHPRCGTNLLFLVVVVSIVLFSLVKVDGWLLNVLARIILIPVVAGIAYEILKLSAKVKWLRWLAQPGIWVQKLTTRQPKADQIEVAIAAVNKAK